MRPTKIIFLLLLAPLLFVCINCKENSSITPPENSLPDTTSHNFTFTSYTFGGSGGSSYFKDVAIINDSDIWAVGAIYTDSATYNAVHWDGKKWSLLRVPSIGSVQFPTLQAIWAMAENNILLSWGGGVITFNGNNFTDDMRMNSLLTGAINKIFALNSQNIYCVGNSGSIVYYNGTNWAKQSSSTTVDLRDVWGSADGKTVWACGYSNDFGESILLENTNGNWRRVYEYDFFTSPRSSSIDSIRGIVSAIWCNDDNKYFVTTDYGNYEVPNNSHGEGTFLWNNSSIGFVRAMRGNKNNDVVMVGEVGTVVHYNGSTWHFYNELFNTQTGPRFWSVGIRKDQIVIVGSKSDDIFSRAIVIRGER